jgi:hypothetical protein
MHSHHSTDTSSADNISAHRIRTNALRAKLQSTGSVRDTVEAALDSLESLGINLPLLLDYISYSEHIREGRAMNPIRHARISLLTSQELPSIIHRWHRRPTKHGQGMNSRTPAQAAIRRVALDIVQQTFVREINEVKDHLKLSTRDISKDVLLGIDFGEICKHIKEGAPTVFECFRAVAWSPVQERRNTVKSPDKVCWLIILCDFY